jgi:hypothetical protein
MRGRRWKCRAMDAEENEKHVSLRLHSPWKSQKARFPHSHRRDDNADGKVEIQKQDSHFATGSISVLKNQRRRLGGRSLRSRPRLISYENQIVSPGSFLNEKMLEPAG